MSNEKRLIDAARRTIATALKRIHDWQFTPGVYEHSIYGKAALLLEMDAVEVVHGRLGVSYMDEYYGEFADCLECGTDNILPCH